MAHLQTIGGSFHGRCYEINEILVIGRGINVDVQVLQPGISRSHCKILQEESNFFAVDLKSKNGTRINGKLIDRVKLEHGDVIEIGKAKYKFTDPVSLKVSSAKGAPQLNLFSKANTDSPGAGTSSFFRYEELEEISKQDLITRLNLIIGIAQDVSSNLNLDTLLIKLIDRILDMNPDTDSCTVSLRDEMGTYKPYHMRYSSEQKIPFHDMFMIKVITSHNSLIKNVSVKTTEGSFKQSILIVPIVYREELLGLIQLQSILDAKSYNDEDLSMISAIGVQISAGIATAKMHTDILQQQRIQQDLEIAQRVQLNFLPSKDPKARGYQFSSLYVPALKVGGDFYNYIPKKESVWVGIGDVSGKGIPAALVMAKLSSEIRFLSLINQSPAKVYTTINAIFEKECSDDFFATALLLEINVKTHEITFANAGHHQPLILTSTGELKEIQGGEIPLGMMPDTNYEDIKFKLETGDTLLLYTDGITESTNNKKAEYGLDRLVKTYKQTAGAPKLRIQTIIKDIKKHQGSARQKDDMTMLCITRDLDEIIINTDTPLPSGSHGLVDYDTDFINIEQETDLNDILMSKENQSKKKKT